VLPEFEIPDPVGPISVVDRISLITKFDSDTDVVMGDQLQPGSVFRTDFDFNIGSFADDSLMNSIQLYSFQAGRGSFIGGGMRITAATGQVLMTGRISALKTTEKNSATASRVRR